jgi:hypothetical protein
LQIQTQQFFVARQQMQNAGELRRHVDPFRMPFGQVGQNVCRGLATRPCVAGKAEAIERIAHVRLGGGQLNVEADRVRMLLRKFLNDCDRGLMALAGRFTRSLRINAVAEVLTTNL